MRTILTLAILSGSTIAAHAGTLDAPAETPTVTPVAAVEETTSWDGFYGGLSYASVSGALNENTYGSGFPAMEDSSAAGAFIGYNWQRGNMVYGAELNYTAVDTNLVGYANSFPESVTEMRGRVGYTALDDLLG